MTNLNLSIRTSPEQIRSLCVANQWYTDGTIGQYNNLLNYVDSNDVLDDTSLDWIAWDIYQHSVNFDYSYPDEQNIGNIKFLILNEACTVSYLGSCNRKGE